LFDTLGYYYFYQIPEGNYMIKTTPVHGSGFVDDFFPSYLGDVLLWQQADIVQVNSNNYELDIHLLPMTGTAYGSGIIGGNVIQYNTGDPVNDVEILLFDMESNALKCVFSGDDGYFEMYNIEFGTYILLTEVTGLSCEPLFVTINEENQIITDLELYINSGVQVDAGHLEYKKTGSLISGIYPNPAVDYITVEFLLPGTEIPFTGQKETGKNPADDYRIQVYDMNGQLLHSEHLFSMDSKMIINVSDYQNGIYAILIIGANRLIDTDRFIVSR
jgi:hypothetical protein